MSFRFNIKSPSLFDPQFGKFEAPFDYKLVYWTRRRSYFLLFFLSLLSFFASLLPLKSGRLFAAITLVRVRTFLKTVQKAPMAHRQWSQDQFGCSYFSLTVLLRSQTKSPKLFWSLAYPTAVRSGLPSSSSLTLSHVSVRLNRCVLISCCTIPRRSVLLLFLMITTLPLSPHAAFGAVFLAPLPPTTFVHLMCWSLLLWALLTSLVGF